jgi:hypothetical protein
MFWPGPENCRTWPATRKHRISKSFFAIPPVESWGFEAQIRNFDWVKLAAQVAKMREANERATTGPHALWGLRNLALAASERYRTLLHCCVHRRLEARIHERIKGMVSSRSSDDPASDGGNMVMSGRSSQRKDAMRQRLAESLRANLRRRKAQQREQKRQQAVPLSDTAKAEAAAPQTLSSQAASAKGIEQPKDC